MTTSQFIRWRMLSNCIHSDNASHLCLIGSYAASDSERKALDSPVQVSTIKDRLDFNHSKLAHLLCPMQHLLQMVDDPVE
ncbi:hypothetical protein J3R82DRAFT_3839 [Butyriboletus roseoflavus]|nr:hypothetical protein J3R82DRAFT_3839 [Butyriboletus roseoflavus]